jgi:hypothetical protein
MGGKQVSFTRMKLTLENNCLSSLAAFLNVGGPLLGIPKAVSFALSGEMKEVSVLGDLGRRMVKTFVGDLSVFTRFFRSLGSIPSMFPRGKLMDSHFHETIEKYVERGIRDRH